MNPEAHVFVLCAGAGNHEICTLILSKFAPVLTHFGREWLLDHKPKGRIIDSFRIRPLHDPHTQCVMELTKDSLLTRREYSTFFLFIGFPFGTIKKCISLFFSFCFCVLLSL